MNPPAPGRRQYVVSVPTGFRAASGKFRAAIRALHDGRAGVPVLASVHEDADKLVTLTEAEVREFRARFPSLTLEPNIPYRKARHPAFDGFQELYVPATAAVRTVTLQVVGADAPEAGLPGVTVYAAVDAAGATGFRGVTDAQGNVTFQVPATAARFSSVAAFPAAGYWNRRVRDVPAAGTTSITVTSLPSPAPERYDWGHAFSGMTDGAGAGGARVRVAVIDTGIRNDHPDLRPAGGRNCVLGEPEEDWFRDEDGHGTHCAGVVAALLDGSGLKGYAPAVDLRAYRVFATGADGAMTFDIATAIQRAVDDGCDVISMSLGSASAQSAIRNKVEYAYDHGVLCVAATGNEGGRVSYPAAFPNVFGVGALGKFGTYPPDSLHREAESAVVGAEGAVFVANFSNFGSQEVDFCAPGVAVRSTVPGGYAAWDGTSMACPQVAGMAALALASHPELRDAPRTSERVDALETVLRRAARPLGVGAPYEGSGALGVPRLVGGTGAADAAG